MAEAWEINGIEGRGKPPSLAGSYTGNLLIVSTGWSVWDDIAIFHTLGFDTEDDATANCHVMAVNGMSLYWRGRLHHAVSLHPEEPWLWMQLRRAYSCRMAHTYTHSQREPKPPASIDFTWEIASGAGGTSSLFAVSIALALGYDHVMLAGVPLDNGGYCYAPPNDQSQFGSRTQELTWKEAARHISGRVRSFSGNSQRWLGDVTPEWLATGKQKEAGPWKGARNARVHKPFLEVK
ncbi:MAG: hypothetical protein AVO39_10325 [delta proteobacterium MLS_D]|jgi:hypothetical protein|nr:MAG: hypothetical protein AVO39_10325 [delta proteobacterium MLS_D]